MYINWFLNYIMKLYWDNVNCIKIRDFNGGLYVIV